MYVENEICSICMAENGYVLKFKNQRDDDDDDGDAPVAVDDGTAVVAKTTAEVLKILKEKIPGYVSKTQEYTDAFDEASKKERAKY